MNPFVFIPDIPMIVSLRPARSNDYAFALRLYCETIKPLARTWIEWIDAEQEAQFASLWRPEDTWIITRNGEEDIGWIEFRKTGNEIFLKQLYISPDHQRRGIGSRVMQRLLEECHATAESIALFVLKNNPACRFYERHGFSIVQETRTKFIMRLEMDKAA